MAADAAADTPALDAAGRTHFEMQVLLVIADGGAYGAEITAALDEHYPGDVIPSRTYQNLKDLVNAGYLHKEADGKRKQYRLTDAGETRVREWKAWVDARLADGGGGEAA